MSHWFDRLAVVAAGEHDGVSRRAVLKGAGMAAFAASPLASPVAAQAAARLEGRAAASPDCDRCLNFSINATNHNMRRCDKTGSLWESPPSGKKRPKARPVNAAKRMACAMAERAMFARDLNECRTGPCAGQPLQPLQQDPNSPFKTPGSGGSSCPPGMTTCSDGSCCFGGDLCCFCIHFKPPGFQCCVAAVGCGCCPDS